MSRNPPLLSHDASRQARRLQLALDLIEQRLDEPLNAEDLAECTAVSRFHFHRIFQAHVGCSVASYITWRRLQRACALLVSGKEPVLEVALSVGFESAQSLAKAMRRELACTPTAVRRGLALPRALPPWRRPHLVLHPMPPLQASAMQAGRYTTLPDGLTALTATGRGMVGNTMVRAAAQAFGELKAVVDATGMRGQVGSWMCMVPDDPKGPDDPHCRYVAGLIFGYQMADAPAGTNSQHWPCRARWHGSRYPAAAMRCSAMSAPIRACTRSGPRSIATGCRRAVKGCVTTRRWS